MLRAALQIIPPPLRRWISLLSRVVRVYFDRLDLGRLRPFRTFDGRHVAVAGVFGTGTGLGRAAELVALTLEARGSRVTRVDLAPALRLPLREQNPGWIGPDACRADDITDVVMVLNPDLPAWRLFERAWLLKRAIIGHWIWEIEQVPLFWERASAGFDEVWAATDLLLDSIRHGLGRFKRPLRLMPYAIDRDPFPRTDPQLRDAVRAREGIAPDVFVVGYSFAVASNYYRKNAEDAVRVFRAAFADTPSALLVLRCNDLESRPFERAALMELIGDDARIAIYDAGRALGMRDFYALLDIYLSTSRAEGYGLNLVEASQSGLPVITSGWRIAPEILSLPGVHAVDYTLEPVSDPQGHYADIAGATWSQPDTAQMVALLQAIRAKACEIV